MRRVELGRVGREVTRVGLGGMPLSIAGRPDRATAQAVVKRAVELGVNFIDTADAYCLDESDIGHNERLISESLREIGKADDVLVATKGGFTRPGGRWEVDGRPEHIRAACERSLLALQVDAIDLYQLHSPDPAVPFEDSVGEFARLLEAGKVKAIGLSNVSLDQLKSAQGIVPITSVQNRFNPWDLKAETTGLLSYCDDEGITFIPYSPVGGGRRVHLLRGDKTLFAMGRELNVTPEQLVLGWILSRSPSLVIIPGASRIASIEASVKADALQLDDEALSRIETAFRDLAD